MFKVKNSFKAPRQNEKTLLNKSKNESFLKVKIYLIKLKYYFYVV